MHFVQRKVIKLEWVSVVVDRRINVVQERQFEVCVDPQEGVDGAVEAYQFNVFSGINNTSIYFAYN